MMGIAYLFVLNPWYSSGNCYRCRWGEDAYPQLAQVLVPPWKNVVIRTWYVKSSANHSHKSQLRERSQIFSQSLPFITEGH
jgi:hypothetical protein